MDRARPKRVFFASSWWNSEMIRGVARYAAKAGWHLDLQMCLTGQIPRTVASDGLIVLPGTERRDISRLIRHSNCPTVALTLNEPRHKLPRVDVDNLALGKCAAEHFLDRGFTTFAFYSRGWQHVDELRFTGFAQAVSAAGYRATRLLPDVTRNRRQDTWPNRLRWLQRHLPALPKPVAIFSTDDTVAVEVIEACLNAHLAIPGDIAVLGVGDFEVFRESMAVPLSSIIVNYDRITHEACALLDQMMAGRKIREDTILIPPGGIAVRRSSDTIAAQSAETAKAIRFIFEHHAEPIGAHDIIRAAGVSKNRLYAAFQRELSSTPAAVLTRVRIIRAKRMLHETREKIQAVAEACGFGDPVNLYRCFHRHAGKSPRAFRREGGSAGTSSA